MEQNKFLMIERYLSSMNYTIPTTQIVDLTNTINKWISLNNCGGIVYGNSRVGKTRAIHYITKNLREVYGSLLPVYTYCATEHRPTEKNFYSSMLDAIGHDEPFRGTAEKMKFRLIARLLEDARKSKYGRVIMFIDEAYLLDPKDYLWLIDIHNRLANEDVIFTVILFGTYELKHQKTQFKRTGKNQIIFRFMNSEVEFKGITSLKEMQMCLLYMDEPFKIKGSKDPINLFELYFPQAYKDGLMLSGLAADLWQAFENINKKYNINQDDILMKHFMDVVYYCLKECGAPGKQIYAPMIEDWEEIIKAIGYVDCYTEE